jgi:hypothetical protein
MWACPTGETFESFQIRPTPLRFRLDPKSPNVIISVIPVVRGGSRHRGRRIGRVDSEPPDQFHLRRWGFRSSFYSDAPKFANFGAFHLLEGSCLDFLMVSEYISDVNSDSIVH